MPDNPVAPFRRNSGGNKVESYAVSSKSGEHILSLRGPSEAATQLLACDPRYAELGTEEADQQWTHRFRGAGSDPSSATVGLMGLLGDVLTLPATPHLEFALALDWYKIPQDGVPGEDWANTTTGDLVARGKYWYKAEPESQREVGLTLVGLMLDTIRRHPVLRDVDQVLVVPGHDAKRVSFGARVAATISRDLPVALSHCTSTEEFRPEAKAVPLEQRRSMIAGKFRCDSQLSGQSVLIVDDVFSSGATMSEVGRAAHSAGASRVFGLAAVRTMRR